MSDRVYLWLDNQTIDALELTLEHLRRAPSRPMSWKWVVIGTHSTLHGAFGLALRRSDGAQLLVPKQERQTYQRWERERATGVPEVDSFNSFIDEFMALYEKVKDPRRMNYFGGKPFVPTGSQDESVEHLNFLRGRLTHFSHIGLVIEPVRVLSIVSDVTGIVRFLLHESRPGVILEWELEERARELLGELTIELADLKERYQGADNI